MQRILASLLLVLLWAVQAPAAGLLIPNDPGAAPLQMLDHTVSVAIDEQVAVTRVEQTFHNPGDRQLEATYVFPVPKCASVSNFVMWVGDKEVKGEMVEAGKARSIYTDVVRRMQDPGLLEYMGNNLLKLRVFPVPARGDQKVAVSFTAVNNRDAGLVEYTYPLKTDDKAARTLRKFRIDVSLKSHDAIHSVYSPTHAVTVEHTNDHLAHAHFERKGGLLDRDFQLYYALGKKDVGLTALFHRPERDRAGHFLLLVSPRAELSRNQPLPRDMVFVLDTSGSMQGPKMQQARNALTFCLDQLAPDDRFAVLNFATVVGQFAGGLSAVDGKHVARAKKWVNALEANGGTAIDAALKAALDLRPADTSRPFTVVFFTDGEPTVGMTDPNAIVKDVNGRNSSHTRIFTLGVGNDVNATLLDGLADSTRAVSTYVRPEEDIEAKVSGLYAKISHPVLTDLKLSAGQGVKLEEVYPNQLPDLFHGGQLVVLGQYTGSGHKTITLHGQVGGQSREFVYELNFPAHTGEDRSFVEGLWARRKVGYLLDEIRRNGEKKELVEEVVKLARKHGITTPYTSYLVVPDNVPRSTTALNVTQLTGESLDNPSSIITFNNNSPNLNRAGASSVAPLGAAASKAPKPAVNQVSDGNQVFNFYMGFSRGDSTSSAPSSSSPLVPQRCPSAAPMFIEDLINSGPAPQPPENRMTTTAPPAASPILRIFNRGANRVAPSASDQQKLREALANNQANTGKLGVDFAVQLDNLRNQNQLDGAPSRKAAGRICRQIAGVWVDEGFDGKQKTVMIKTLSTAYFRMLEKQPVLQEVFQLGNCVVWVTPSGTTLVISPDGGQETMSDAEIERLFVKK